MSTQTVCLREGGKEIAISTGVSCIDMAVHTHAVGTVKATLVSRGALLELGKRLCGLNEWYRHRVRTSWRWCVDDSIKQS